MKVFYKGIEIESEECSIRDLIKANFEGDFTETLVAKLNGKVVDLSHPIEDGAKLEPLTFADEEGKKALWHTTSHVLAYAIKNLYPDVKLAIGPATNEGFYYGFDLEKIEAEMKRIIKENYKVYRKTISKAEALKFFANEPYKVELIENLEDGAEISIYTIDEFTDLGAGPHIYDLSKIKAYMLKSITGAYWHGDSKNAILIFKLVCLWNRWTEEHGVVERKRFTLNNAADFFNFNYEIKNLLELIYRRNLRSTVYDAFYEVMMPQYGTNAFECYESRFYSYALFGLLDEWVKRGFYESVEQMVENVNRICGRRQ